RPDGLSAAVSRRRPCAWTWTWRWTSTTPRARSLPPRAPRHGHRQECDGGVQRPHGGSEGVEGPRRRPVAKSENRRAALQRSHPGPRARRGELEGPQRLAHASGTKTDAVKTRSTEDDHDLTRELGGPPARQTRNCKTISRRAKSRPVRPRGISRRGGQPAGSLAPETRRRLAPLASRGLSVTTTVSQEGGRPDERKLQNNFRERHRRGRRRRAAPPAAA